MRAFLAFRTYFLNGDRLFAIRNIQYLIDKHNWQE